MPENTHFLNNVVQMLNGRFAYLPAYMSLSHYSLNPHNTDSQREKSIKTARQSFPSDDKPPELSLEP